VHREHFPPPAKKSGKLFSFGQISCKILRKFMYEKIGQYNDDVIRKIRWSSKWTHGVIALTVARSMDACRQLVDKFINIH